MKIIKLKESDNIEKIVAIFDQYMMFYKLPSSIEKYKKFLSDRLENKDAIIFLAVDEHENPIGFVLNYPSYSTLSLGKILVLNDLFVLREERKKRVAQALINAVFEFAKQENIIRIDLCTEKSNENAQKLYEKLGFKKAFQYDYYSYDLKK